jgi:DNA transformation protein and related proteins
VGSMPKSDPFVEFAIEQLAPLGEITSRAMMGGWCLYCDGVIFALIADGELYLKCDEVNQPRFDQRGLRPFQPFPDKPGTMKYFQAPPEMFEDRSAVLDWAGHAVEAGRRAAAKTRKPVKKKRAAGR